MSTTKQISSQYERDRSSNKLWTNACNYYIKKDYDYYKKDYYHYVHACSGLL